MLTSDQARDLVAHVIGSQGATVLDTSDPIFETVLGLLNALDFVVPGSGSAVSQVMSTLTSRSNTVPGPAGPLVVLSRAGADPIERVVDATEQAVIAAQMKRAGQVQTWADFLGSGELRALRLGHALAAGAFARHLLTGEEPDIAALVAAAHTMAAPLPVSTSDEVTLRTVLASQLSGLGDGERPSIAAAGSVLARLREVVPEAIVAEGWRS